LRRELGSERVTPRERESKMIQAAAREERFGELRSRAEVHGVGTG
jgi:hypothetical protein